MRPDLDTWAMDLAKATAQRTTCLRRGVGAVLLDARGHVLATGYNGVASGLPHCNEVTGEIPNPALEEPGGTFRAAEHWERETVPVFGHACPGAHAESGTQLDCCLAIHAEQNALLQCRDVYTIHTAFVTTAPCITCCKLLLNTSCIRIVYLEEYPGSAARELWEASGRIWARFEEVRT